MGGENASAAMQNDGPVTPMKRGRGRRVSNVSLDVLRCFIHCICMGLDQWTMRRVKMASDGTKNANLQRNQPRHHTVDGCTANDQRTYLEVHASPIFRVIVTCAIVHRND
jgi:hypothetical protein